MKFPNIINHFSKKRTKSRIRCKFSFKKKSNTTKIIEIKNFVPRYFSGITQVCTWSRLKQKWNYSRFPISHPSFLDWIEREQFLYRALIRTNTIGISLGTYRKVDSHACRRFRISAIYRARALWSPDFFPLLFFFLFFSLPLPFFACSRYSGIPETFALFMRVRLKPRSAVYHLNEKY